MCERCSECREPIENGDTDVNFGDLVVKVSCHEALAEQFNAMHFRLDIDFADDSRSIVSRWAVRDGHKSTRRHCGLMAPGKVGFHCFAFFRGGTTTQAPRAAMVS